MRRLNHLALRVVYVPLALPFFFFKLQNFMVYINSARGYHGGPIFFKKHLLHENAYVLIGRSETFLKVIHSSLLDFIFQI